MVDELEPLSEPEAEAGTPARRRVPRILRRASLLSWILVQVVGWIAALASMALWVGERTGVINYQLQREITRRLGPGAGRFAIESTEIRWLERTVRLRGVRLGAGGRDVSLDRVDCRLGWSARRGPHIEAAEIIDGRVRISRALTRSMRGLTRGDTTIEGDPVFPTLVVRNLTLLAETPDHGDLELGSLDACLSSSKGERPRIAGRLLPQRPGSLAPGGLIHLSGEWKQGDVIEVDATGRDLEVTMAYLPAGTVLETLRDLDPKGVFDLHAHGRYVLGHSVFPEVDTSILLRDGSVSLAQLDQSIDSRVESIRMELGASFEPRLDQDLWSRDAWDATARLQATWDGTEAQAWARFGEQTAEGVLAEAWVHAPDVDVAKARRVTSSLPWFEEFLWPMLEPEGSADLYVAVRAPAHWRPEVSAERTLERAVAVVGSGHASVAYHGSLGDDGQRNLGFPLRMTDISGQVVYAFDPGVAFPEQIGLFDLRGREREGSAHVHGAIHLRPEWFWPPGDTGVDDRERTSTCTLTPTRSPSTSGCRPPSRDWRA